MTTKEEKLNTILDCLEKKNFFLAKSILNQLLTSYPQDYLLENIFGVILSEEKNYTDAILRFKKSIEMNKNFADGYYNLATLLLKINLNDEAIENFKKAINLKPDYFEAYYNLANIYSRNSNFPEAEKYYKICLNIRPDSLEVLNNIGINLKKEGKFFESIEIFNKLLNLDKFYYLAYINLGMVYSDISNFEEAIKYINKAIKIKPDYFEGYEKLGFVYFSSKKYSQAIFFYEQAIKLNNDYCDALTGLGNVYSELCNYDESILLHKKAIYINKNFYKAYLNLAKTYLKSKKNYSDAVSVLKKVISLKKDYAEAFNLLAICNIIIGEPFLAANYFEESLKIDPDTIDLYSNYIWNTGYIKNFNQKRYFELTNNLFRLIRKTFNYNVTATRPYKNEKKLKIGFVSGDFRNHPVGYFIDGILPFLKKNDEIEIFAYSNNRFEDDLTKRIKPLFSEWFVIDSIDDLNLINMIKNYKIDILVDLSGHSSLNRLSVFLHKPAPIQVTWAGYLASTGLDKIDYMITDDYVESKIKDSQFVEKTYKMPYVWCHFSRPQSNPIVRDNIPALINGYITFGSFNNSAKINLEVIKLWSKILNSIPNSKIFLKANNFDDRNIRDIFLKKFFDNNVDRKRIILEGSSDRKTLLEKYNLIDIALDPFPYNGGTTSFEASWMCVPILTLAGDSFLSKCGESINVNLDMKEWIAKDEDEYLKKAVRFSSNLEELNLIKKRLHYQKKVSKIFDSETFALDLVTAFKNMSKNL